jgi:5-methylthioadenosine/S-adenosylhomocysteine deaminase
MQTLFTNCTIFTGPGEPLLHDRYLVTSGSTITALGTTADLPDLQDAKIIDCSGKLLMPGLINGHNHCAMTLFRGLADDLDLSTWLHHHIFPAEKAHVSREMTYWCTRLAAAEMILSGTTCVADAYFFSGESARALRDCGMRAVVGHGVVDFPAPSVPDPKKNIETVARFIDEWQDIDPLITPAVFAHAPYTCSPATLRKAKALADDRNVRFFTHLAESRNEPEMIIGMQDTSPLRHLAGLDLLDSNSVLIHAVWLDDRDLEILAESGAHIVTCPQSNLKLASGIARIPEMIARGITVGVGTDGCASNNGLDMFREMDVLAKLHKLSTLDATALPAVDALRAATSANAELLGLSDLGRLQVGNKADLILIDLQIPRLTPFYNTDLLVYAAGGHDVHSTMINGRMVMENRKILSFDLEETVARVQQIAALVDGVITRPA